MKVGENCEILLDDIEVLLIDEFGMVSTKLLYKLLKFVSKELPKLKKIVFIGDSNQLEPIGYGSPLKYLVYSKNISTTELNKIVRQNDKCIPEMCNYINNGDFTKLDRKFKKGTVPFQDKLVLYTTLHDDLFSRYKELRFSAISNTNSGCYTINKYIQDNIYKRGHEGEKSVKMFIDDKILITKNSYENNVVNGDFGYIRSISEKNRKKNDSEKKLSLEVCIRIIRGVEFSDSDDNDIIYNISVYKISTESSENTFELTNPSNFKVFIVQDELTQMVTKYYVNAAKDNCPFDLGYCATVHKYQGSETNLGLIFIDKKGSYIQTRSLLYTAISRCKSKIVLVGDLVDIKKIVERENIDSFSYLDKLMMDTELSINYIIDTNIVNFRRDYNEFNWYSNKPIKNIKLGDIKLETNWPEYKTYNNMKFKKILSKYSSENLAYAFVNNIIKLGDMDKINSNNMNVFYKYINSRIK